MASATATNSYLSSQMLNATNNILKKKIIKECADKYASASDALHNSVQDLGAELYDYAYMHVMAAADYPNACQNAFKRYPGLVYPPEIGIREDGLKQICDVVLGIIDTLACMPTKSKHQESRSKLKFLHQTNFTIYPQFQITNGIHLSAYSRKSDSGNLLLTKSSACRQKANIKNHAPS
ncbi:PMEI domain-containing protein [Forsythia ovata]|uniref:PMEI domain-containing protein n=1 Tax=Forsythia ovata TaxID=205694 RepID=A0ABD1U8F5_9LAMI